MVNKIKIKPKIGINIKINIFINEYKAGNKII